MTLRNLAFTSLIPLFLSPAYAAPFAYVPNSGDGTVSVIDTATNRVTATVTIGSGAYAIAVTKTRAYILDVEGLAAIDTASNQLIGRLSIPQARAVAATDASPRVYVSAGPRNVVVVDSDAHSVIGTIELGQREPAGIAVSPDGSRVYVANTYDGTERRKCSVTYDLFCDLTVSTIDTATNSEVARTPIGDQLSGVAVSHDGRLVYVTHIGIDRDTVFEPGNIYGLLTVFASDLGGFFKRIRVIDGQGTPFAVAVGSPSATAYVVAGSHLKIIDPESGRVSADILIGNDTVPLYGVSVTPDGRRVYVPRIDNDTVVAIDTTTKSIIATIPVGHAPYAFGQFITPEATPTACVGDCNGDATVSIDEVLTCVNVALGNQPIGACLACTCSGCETTVADIVAAVNHALGGC
jgi:YVTN family beta-propeller protein